MTTCAVTRAAPYSARRSSDFSLADSIRAAIIILIVTLARPAAADETPRTGVIDDAHVINAETQRQINVELLELEQKTGAQLKVWTMTTTQGRDLYSLAMETARKWRLGQNGKNNGALVAIAVKDRKWQIVTGEGVEDVLPDLLTDRIAQSYFVPFFKQGNYSQGIHLAVAAMAQAIADKDHVQLTGVPKVGVPQGHQIDRRFRTATCALNVLYPVAFIAIIAVVASVRRRQYRHRWGGGLGDLLFWSYLLGGSGRGGSWGSGSGGSSWGSLGGGGGFGGGGGGSFGGGGSGGSW